MRNISPGVNMKTLAMKQLDEKDEEIVDTLISLGMSRPIARTLSYLQNSDETTSIDLERGTRLRQPEVSVAMKELKERDWIKEREEKKPGKGRPYKVYSLKMDFKEIIAHFERQKMKELNEMQSKIRRLRELEKQ